MIQNMSASYGVYKSESMEMVGIQDRTYGSGLILSELVMVRSIRLGNKYQGLMGQEPEWVKIHLIGIKRSKYKDLKEKSPQFGHLDSGGAILDRVIVCKVFLSHAV